MTIVLPLTCRCPTCSAHLSPEHTALMRRYAAEFQAPVRCVPCWLRAPGLEGPHATR